MTSLLELPAVRERVHRLSVQDYHLAGETGLLGEDVELLRGIVVTKMPKSPMHELVAQKLTGLVRPEDRCVTVFRQPESQGYLSRETLTEEDILQAAGIPGVQFKVADILPSPSR